MKRIFGQFDMYRDIERPTPEQQQYIEKMFSAVENKVSVIFRKITNSFDQQEDGIWLTRDERNLIRKFLFLQKYRGSNFHRRFHHDDPKSYNENDTELLLNYMRERGYKRTVDVWLDNLKTIMELDMDLENKWIIDLPNRMYPGDARWFITHAQSTYMTICTPSNPSDEFILTDNSYNVFEGPSSFVTDENTGTIREEAYIPLHEFGPISLKLMIVLRSNMFPDPEEDAHPDVKKERDFFRHVIGESAYKESWLSDLPVRRASNNYSQGVGSRLHYINDESWQQKRDHKFFFKFFAIEMKHVHTINRIFLDNGLRCTNMVFGSRESLSQTLEKYLSESWTGEKNIMGDNGDLLFKYLKKLDAISRSLGSQKTMVWREEPIITERDRKEAIVRLIEMERYFPNLISDAYDDDNDDGDGDDKGSSPEALSTTKTEFMQIYAALGASTTGNLFCH